MQLSADALAQYRRDGLVIFRQLFSRTAVELLRLEVDRVAGLRAEEGRREGDEGLPKAMYARHEAAGPTGSANNRWQTFLCYNRSANHPEAVAEPHFS